MNIVFSSTRQWNPGDEFILTGCLRLMRAVLGHFNPILYNRNPQIRRDRKYDLIKRIDDWLGRDFIEKFKDNSVRDRAPLDYADLVVFAGSPEWRGRRLTKLYSSILEFNIPAIFLGIGTNREFRFTDEFFTSDEQTVLRQALLICVRDDVTATSLAPLEVVQLPCPALLASETHRAVHQVNRIGLIYGSRIGHQRVSERCYKFCVGLYKELLIRYAKDFEIEFIAHYIDDLVSVRNDFPEWPVHYSYDSQDYFKIYDRFDLVIGPRIHGIGLAASQGIPGILVGHDGRARTAAGFKAQIVSIEESPHAAVEVVNRCMSGIQAASEMLAAHKKETERRYLSLLRALQLRAQADQAGPLLIERLLANR